MGETKGRLDDARRGNGGGYGCMILLNACFQSSGTLLQPWGFTAITLARNWASLLVALSPTPDILLRYDVAYSDGLLSYSNVQYDFRNVLWNPYSATVLCRGVHLSVAFTTAKHLYKIREGTSL